MSKPPFSGCWSFCTPDCKLKEYNGCRTNIPKYDLPAPNESCLHISGLLFGRSDYDTEVKAWHQAKNVARKNKTPPPPDWREAVQDRYALRPIFQDPTGDWLSGHKYLPVQLWCPDLLYEMLLASPVIIQAVSQAVEGGAGIMQMRQLEKQISLLFRTGYKSRWWLAEEIERSIPAREPYLQPTIEQHWAKAWKFFELALPTIAQWCLLHYCSFPEQWAVLLARHVTFSQQWLRFAERVAVHAGQGDATRPPSKVKRVGKGETFSTVKQCKPEAASGKIEDVKQGTPDVRSEPVTSGSAQSASQSASGIRRVPRPATTAASTATAAGTTTATNPTGSPPTTPPAPGTQPLQQRGDLQEHWLVDADS